MKRIVRIIIISAISLIVAFVLLFVGMLVYVDKTEWSLRSKDYNVSIPITIKNGTIAEIEEQARVEALKEYPNAYLGEISWRTRSNKGFETLADGTIDFKYCENLGTWHGYYGYNRYALCDVTVDLGAKQITKIDIYGNSQLGGREEFKTYPDFKEIRGLLHENWRLSDFHGEYEVSACYVDILHGYASTANFTIKLPDGTEQNLEGKIENGILTFDRKN